MDLKVSLHFPRAITTSGATILPWLCHQVWTPNSVSAPIFGNGAIKSKVNVMNSPPIHLTLQVENSNITLICLQGAHSSSYPTGQTTMSPSCVLTWSLTVWETQIHLKICSLKYIHQNIFLGILQRPMIEDLKNVFCILLLKEEVS